MAVKDIYVAYTGLLLSTGTYIDTEILPSDTQSIEMLFCGQSVNGYIFGARNTGSNASAGQVNFFSNFNANGTGALNYFGYASQRISVSDTNTGDSMRFIRYGKVKNELQITKGTLVLNTLGATTEFEGTRTMYIGALNNAGTPLYRTGGSLYFLGGKIDGESIIPVYCKDYMDEDLNINPMSGAQIGATITGFYPLANSQGLVGNPYRVRILNYDRHGHAHIRLCTGDKVEDVYCYDDPLLYPHLIAEPDEGYVFKNWTDHHGYIISTESDFWYRPTEGTVFLYPHFEKKTDIDVGTGYRTLAIEYGAAYLSGSLEEDIYANILSASISVDIMQKTSSTIELESMPSAYQINMPIFVINPKGKVIYEGVIKSVEGNTLTCREPLSVFDFDFLFHANTNTFAKTTLENAMYQIMSLAAEYGTDDATVGEPLLNFSNRLYNGFTFSFTNHGRVNQINIINPTPPLISSPGVTNLEDYFLDTFGNSGVYPKAELKKITRTSSGVTYEYHRMNLEPISIEDRELLVLSDNDENMKDISISSDSENPTVLIVYNSAGTAIRAVYSISTNGTVYPKSVEGAAGYHLTSFDIAYSDYNVKIIMSNDDLYGIVKENLAQGRFNNGITFTEHYLNGYDFDKIKILQPVEFHYRDKVYNSVVTGWKFNIDAISNKVTSVNYILGSVRTNLTSKINIKRKR